MDKRTLFFVFSLSLALMLVNIWFTRQDAERKKAWLEDKERKEQIQALRLQDDVAKRLVSIDALPVVQIAQGVPALQVDGGFLALLPKEKELPKTVAIGKDSYTLKQKALVGDSLFVHYSADDKALRLLKLPEKGHYDLHLLQIDGMSSVHLGEWVDGTLSIPLNPPGGEALALIKDGNSYRPVGVYDSEGIDTLGSLEIKFLDLASPVVADSEETFYILESKYQQLVFSSVGGALVEINLPFESDTHPDSTVKEIEFDRKLSDQSPANLRYPLHGQDVKQGGYYPLIRRSLVSKSGVKETPPTLFATNIVSEYPGVAELVYTVKEQDAEHIVFEASQRHRRITKTYSFGKGPYMIDLTVKVEGDSRKLWLTSGVPEVEWISGSPAPSVHYRLTRNGKQEVLKLDLPKDSSTMSSIQPDWVTNSNGFLGIIIDPLTEVGSGFKVDKIPGTALPSRLTEIDTHFEHFKAKDLPGYQALVPLNPKGGSMQFRIYAGPFADKSLSTVDSIYGDTDYISSQSYHGWFAFISRPFAKLLFIFMKVFHDWTDSWAASIVLLTIVLRVMLYPLNAWSFRSMRRMQVVAPEVTAIQNKYKKDPKKAQMEVMNLYREKGVNPLSGCFPMLIQMPFLIGMFDLLKSTFELRGAVFVPGWIDNLTSPDVLFSWDMPLFFIGTEFHLLPILLGAIMFVQAKMNAPSPGDGPLTDQQRQSQAMGTMMSVVFTFMFYKFPSGLNIYWLSSMLIGILQQWYNKRQVDKEAAAPAVAS